jgi:thioredoxin reductase (NADPH)
VREGSIEIIDNSRDTPRVIAVHRPGHFTGDVDMLTGRPALVTARVAEDGQVLTLSAVELRRAIDELPEAGETIVKAFLMRRTLLLDQGFEGVKIIGSRFSPDAHRLRDFATRNGVPFRWIDLDSDEQAEMMLRQLGVPTSATPIVLGRQGRWHRNPSLADFARCAGLTPTLEEDHVYDLIVVGAGPAGLAASVYAASEGLGRAGRGCPRGGRSGRHQHADRELSRISRRDLGKRPHPECSAAGATVRRSHHSPMRGPLAWH